DPREQVEVALAVGVPHVAALSAHEDALGRAEGVGEGTRVALLPALRARDAGLGRDPGEVLVHSTSASSGTTIVPMPLAVKTSMRTECATRPSTTCARATPPETARRHASILGTIPDSRLGRSSARAETRIVRTRVSRSGQRV